MPPSRPAAAAPAALAPLADDPAFVSAVLPLVAAFRSPAAAGSLAAELLAASAVAAKSRWVSADGLLRAESLLHEVWCCDARHPKALEVALCFAAALWTGGGPRFRLSVVVQGPASLPLLAVVLRAGANSLVALRIVRTREPLPRELWALVSPLAGLPHLYSVRLEGHDCAPGTVRWWVGALALHAAPSLRHLDIEPAAAAAAVAAAAARWDVPLPRTLTTLAMRGADEEMALGLGTAAAECCPGLERLTVEYSSLTPPEPRAAADMARLLGGLPRLRSLSLDARGKSLCSASWAALSRMAGLRELRLTCVECAPGHEAALDAMLHAGMPELESLTLQHSFHGELGSVRRLPQVLRSAASLPALASLSCTHFAAYRLTRAEMGEVVAALAAIAAPGRLRSLSLTSMPMDDALIGQLAAGIVAAAEAAAAKPAGPALEVFSLSDFGCEEADFACSPAALDALGDALGRCPALRTASVDFSRLLVSSAELDSVCASLLSRFMGLRYLAEFRTARFSYCPVAHDSLSPQLYPLTRQQMDRWHRLRDREAASHAAWAVVAQGIVRQKERRLLQGAGARSLRDPAFASGLVVLLPASVLVRAIGSFLQYPESRLLIS